MRARREVLEKGTFKPQSWLRCCINFGRRQATACLALPQGKCSAVNEQDKCSPFITQRAIRSTTEHHVLRVNISIVVLNERWRVAP
jgi:hypothetical protein